MRKLSILILAALAACTGSDAVEVQLPVTTSAAPLPAATTDLGYRVRLDQLRVAVFDLELTIEGETHDVARVPPPPHPGHEAGGEVTGELRGDYVLRWNGQPQPPLGEARLLTGDYHGANLGFRAAGAGDGLVADDPLLGHTFHLRGTVERGGAPRPFDAVLDVEPDSAVIGAVFDATVEETTTATLALTFLPTDPVERDTAFDGIEFDQLPVIDNVSAIRPGSTAHNVLRRALVTHDLYAVTLE